MPLQSGLQVVVQYPHEQEEDLAVCRGFVDLPVTNPVYISVVPTTSAAASAASELGKDLARCLFLLSGSAREISTPCGGMHSPSHCHALKVPECVKVLLPVIDPATSPRPHASYIPPQPWVVGRGVNPGERIRIVPVLASGCSVTALPSSLRALNVAFWKPGDTHAANRILSACDIGSSSPRIFISYVRRDTAPIAEQLFDALHREGFEVFLDRFSIEPGVDFQVRLTEKLSYMGFILVLESRNILKSSWVQHEVNFARAHRLGLGSIKVAGGKSVPGIRPKDRIALNKGALTKKRRLLRAPVLREILPWIIRMHGEAEFRRRRYLQDTMSYALSLNGITRQQITDDVLLARNRRGEGIAIRVCNLPPELPDFHIVSDYQPPTGGKCFVVAPSTHMTWRRKSSFQWLGSVSDITLEDEANIYDLGRRLR